MVCVCCDVMGVGVMCSVFVSHCSVLFVVIVGATYRVVMWYGVVIVMCGVAVNAVWYGVVWCGGVVLSLRQKTNESEREGS
jgi:hypothetical protein